jgi:RHS repeat-associated protein
VGLGTTYFIHTDWLGTERARTNLANAVVENCQSLAFGDGQVCTGSDVSPLHFTGKVRDTESNLDDFDARYYSSQFGRFMTPDWDIKPAAVPYAAFGDPLTLNLYTYVENAPLNRIDADGHRGSQGAQNSWVDHYICEPDGATCLTSPGDPGPNEGMGDVEQTEVNAAETTTQTFFATQSSENTGAQNTAQQTPTITMTIQRDTETAHSTQGTFTVSSTVPGSGTVTGVTLEPPAKPDPAGNGTTRMPAGTYSATERPPGYSRINPVLLLSVPGHTAVEVHPGNYPSNTEMCVLPGTTRGTDYVGNSRAAVNSIRNYIDNINSSSGTTASIQVVVRDPTP